MKKTITRTVSYKVINSPYYTVDIVDDPADKGIRISQDSSSPANVLITREVISELIEALQDIVSQQKEDK